MRTALSALCLMLAGCSGGMATEPLGERLSILIPDMQSPVHSGAAPLTVPPVFVVMDGEGWSDCWSRFSYENEILPQVDFETSMVLGIRVDFFSLVPQLDSIVRFNEGARAYFTVRRHSTPLAMLPRPWAYTFVVPRISIVDVITGQPEIHGAPFPGCSLAAVN